MSTLVPVVFNLSLNAAVSFSAALGLVALVLRVTKLRPGRARLLLLLSPFAKLLWDLARGIPARSFLWVHALGAKQELGSFELGFGLRPARPPFIHAVLNSHYGGLMYSQSAADLAFRGLEQKLSPLVPALLVAVLVGVALVRMGLQLRSIWRFRREAGELLRTAEFHGRARVGLRDVNIYASREYAGAPYAAGVVHPHVMFSASTLTALDAPAREAAIWHELSHIEWHDPLLVTSLALLNAALWFLPGRSWLTRRVLREIELCADQRALERGADPTSLANALVSVGEQLYPAPVEALGLAPQKHLLRERVERLLASHEASGQSLLRRLARTLLVLGFVSSVLCSAFFGN